MLFLTKFKMKIMKVNFIDKYVEISDNQQNTKSKTHRMKNWLKKSNKK